MIPITHPEIACCKHCRFWTATVDGTGICTPWWFLQGRPPASVLRTGSVTQATDWCTYCTPNESIVEAFRSKSAPEIARRLEEELSRRSGEDWDDTDMGVMYKGVVFRTKGSAA